MKKVYSLSNNMGGIDLITEIDSGNLVRIPTGKRKSSIAFWTLLETVCQDAIVDIKMEDDTCPLYRKK